MQRLLNWIALAAWLILLSTELAHAEAATTELVALDAAQKTGIHGPRPQDEIWLINTREIGCWSDKSPPTQDLQVARLDESCEWRDSNLDEFWAGDFGLGGPLTAMYVHGNMTGYGESLDEGLAVYYALAGEEPAAAIRFVIWSWPSDRVKGIIRDVRIKANRADYQGELVAWLLGELDARAQHPRIGLVGYSFGARVVLAALHQWQQEPFRGPLRHDARIDGESTATRARVSLLAAADHNYYLQPGQRRGSAYDRIDHMLNLYNSCDLVLKRYRVVQRCGRPQALGYTGLVGRGSFADYAERIDQWDVCCHNGKTHSIIPYLTAASSIDAIRRYVLWQPVE